MAESGVVQGYGGDGVRDGNAAPSINRSRRGANDSTMMMGNRRDRTEESSPLLISKISLLI